MSLHRRTAPSAAPWARLLAAACVLLTLLLGVAAQNPALHDRLHHLAADTDCPGEHHAGDNRTDTADAGDAHKCAITQFAQGILTAAATPPELHSPAPSRVADAVARELLIPAAPLRVHPPSQAPPTGC